MAVSAESEALLWSRLLPSEISRPAAPALRRLRSSCGPVRAFFQHGQHEALRARPIGGVGGIAGVESQIEDHFGNGAAAGQRHRYAVGQVRALDGGKIEIGRPARPAAGSASVPVRSASRPCERGAERPARARSSSPQPPIARRSRAGPGDDGQIEAWPGQPALHGGAHLRGRERGGTGEVGLVLRGIA